MIRDAAYIIIGYIFGSVLFSKVSCSLLKKGDVAQIADDGNPGASNAFRYGGFMCGCMTLTGDILKGCIPVLFYTHGEQSAALALVIAAPVIGHAFPIFYGFRGGKGIATTFGCLLGLLPEYRPLAILAVMFIFFSVALCIRPNYYRIIVTYICAQLAVFALIDDRSVRLGSLIICATVLARMFMSKEQKNPIEVKLLWTR